MIQVRYYLTDSPSPRTTYENKKEETVTRVPVSSEDKTITTSVIMTRDINSVSSDNYSVKIFTTMIAGKWKR